MKRDNQKSSTGTTALDLRVEPKQARARETVARILDTACVLLDEVGLDDFNTNLLAERAEVRVRTVYRYFPNKTAVILAVSERTLREWDAWALEELERLDDDVDWRTALGRSTQELFRRIRELPGQAAIRRAMRAIPELYALDQRDNERLAEAYAEALRRVGPGLTRTRAQRVARCLVESTGALLDVALEQPPAAGRGLVDELVNMQVAYIEAVLG